jgi:hypothetical protein
MYSFSFDIIIETKNLKTALNKAKIEMKKLNLDSNWLDLDITKDNENLFQQTSDYRLRIETFGQEINQKCFYIDIAYN